MSLLDTTTGLLTPELISTAIKGLGIGDESPVDVSSAVKSSASALLVGMARIASSESGAVRLFDMVTERDYEGLLFGRNEDITAEQAEEISRHGQSMITRLFGDRASGMIELISHSSGVERRSSAALLGLVTPVVAAVLGREVSSKEMSVGGLADLLSNEKQAIQDDPRTPAGLAGLFGPSSAPSPAGAARTEDDRLHDATAPGLSRKTVPPAYAPSHTGPSHEGQSRRWVVPAVLGALVIGGLWALLHERAPDVSVPVPRAAAPRGPRENVIQPVAPQVEPPRVEAPPAPVKAPRAGAPSEAAPKASGVVEQLKITAGAMTLPGGKVFSVDEHGSEAALARYLDAGAVDAPKRFSMDRMSFEPGSATPDDASQPKLDALAGILAAYPSVRVRIEGHTDSDGSPDANKSLSLARAQAVRQQLTARNIAPNRIEVAGLGATHPAASNDSAAGRAENRRIDVMVLSR